MSSKLNRFGLGLAIILILAGVHWSRLPHGQLRIDFLNIGQGDAILLSLPTGEHVLVDGGPEQVVLRELGEVMPFLDRRIDLMVLTHPHADHMMGLVQVLRRYEVKKVLFSGVNYWSPIYNEFLKEIRTQQIPLIVATTHEDFSIGAVDFDILFPFESMLGEELSNLNNGSVVMKVTLNEQSLLLVGDAEIEVEEELVAAHDQGEINLRSDLLKSGHHGSRTASSLEFLQRVQPEMVVIQCGVDNQFEHPHKETLENYARMGIEVRRNDLEGRIRVNLLAQS